MENFYLIVVIILFALAVSDLVVGVSNDAVNFLNSAFGSKVAPKWVIFLMAAGGVLIGATFSSGMMEVARKGIFHPDMFVFSEIIVIFLAVMITDVILLDMFNTFSMPTSTTVSIVFELLGSAVAVSLVKIAGTEGSLGELSGYINSEKALAIIAGILLSVFIAFTFGALIQYVTRLIFSFNYDKPMKYFGSLFGGIAITAITYFMLIKGMKGSSFSELEVTGGEKLGDWVISHTSTILLFSLGFWIVVLQLLRWLFKIDILKLIVLVGTFALAMAFAGNDLVNFIGVPVAGFKSFQAWIASGGVSPDTFSMEMLREKSSTPVIMLLISGLIMVITLITSQKAQSVTETEINLGRQSEGIERFGSSLIARLMVRNSLKFNRLIAKVLPYQVNHSLKKQFTPLSLGPENDPETPAFDKVRASINLIVASILIAFGTSLKLPLSTTYVTFMVAMGTSLADRAWDRESAVYRISGVFAVIGGWFLTALVAFTFSGVIAFLILVGGKFMILIFMAVAVYMVIRTHIFFKRKRKNMQEEDDETILEKDETEKVLEKCKKQVIKSIILADEIFSGSLKNFENESRSKLKEVLKIKDDFNKKSKKKKNKVLSVLSKIEDNIDCGHFYVQVVDYQREMAHSLNFLVEPLFEHLNNHHKPFIKAQNEELKSLRKQTDDFFEFALKLVKEDKFNKIDNLIKSRDKILQTLGDMEIAQIKRIKAKEVNTRNAVLFFNTITETKNMLLHAINLIKAHRDFILVTEKEKT
jgi:phosphate/sulfate permease